MDLYTPFSSKPSPSHIPSMHLHRDWPSLNTCHPSLCSSIWRQSSLLNGEYIPGLLSGPLWKFQLLNNIPFELLQSVASLTGPKYIFTLTLKFTQTKLSQTKLKARKEEVFRAYLEWQLSLKSTLKLTPPHLMLSVIYPRASTAPVSNIRPVKKVVFIT